MTQHRAYALPLVLGLLLLLSTTLGAAMLAVNASQFVSESGVHRQQAFHNAEGVAIAVAELASAKLRTLPTSPPVPPTHPDFAAELQRMLEEHAEATNLFVEANAGTYETAGYTVEVAEVSSLGPAELRVFTSGAFQGLQAQVQSLGINVTVRREHDRTPGRQAVIAQIDRATLSMFQFFAFIDGYAFIFNGPGAKYAGRMHSNGNMCIGAGADTYMERITSGGSIHRLGGSGCRNEKSGSGGDVFVARVDLENGINSFPPTGAASDFKKISDKQLADSPTWVADAAQWNNHMTDRAHGVPVLKPPITGSPRAQMGRNALGTLVDNSGTSRFLIDPLLDGEPDDVQAQKIAFKADLRIVNGVWYLRDPSRPQKLGEPIWSDRPGKTASLVDERWDGVVVDVGQDDIHPGPRPRRYSYYRTTGAGTAALATTSNGEADAPVVSYGTVVPKTGSTGVRWVPGAYATGASTLTEATTPGQLLQGTRSGFRSAWDEVGVQNNAADCSASVDRKATLGFKVNNAAATRLFNMLPINFDVAAFQNALKDLAAGELGARFAARPFNGIVFISSTWPGSNDGYGNASVTPGRATFWPPQGSQNDEVSTDGATTGQPAAGFSTLNHDAVTAPSPLESNGGPTPPYQRALPKVFCSDDSGALVRTQASFGSETFKAPRCTSYMTTSATQLLGTVNAVRVINARVLDKATLPLGLSIVTNLPMFLLGDINKSSIPADKASQVIPTSSSSAAEVAAAATWVPFMLGGDTIGLLSNAWVDDETPWNRSTQTLYGARVPSDTSYHG
ncbi:MAG TPA: hypothetical protein VGF99_12710, partial [Myxococcota bacterium]